MSSPAGLTLFWDWIDRYLLPLDDPGSRLFGLNLLAAAGLAAAYLFAQGRGQAGFSIVASLRAALCSRHYWWNLSTRADYRLYLANSVLKLALLVPFVKLSFMVSAKTLVILWKVFGFVPALAPSLPALLAYSAAAFVLDDFLRFAHHLLMHKLPWLWRLHEVHHSARVLTPLTLFRVHPLESLLATARNSLSVGLALGAYLFLFQGEANLASLAGAGAFGFLFNLLGSNLRHSHLALSFGRFERLFISPAQHQLHHDVRARNCNYGVSLALWDNLNGSLRLYRPGTRLRFGSGRRAQPLFHFSLPLKPLGGTMKYALKLALVFLLPLLFSVSALAEQKKKILIYNFAEPTYEGAFLQTAEALGIDVEINHDSPAILLSNLKDPNNPDKPDLVIHHDALHFRDFAQQGVFQPIHSAALEASVPEQYRDLAAGWVGLSYHARTIIYNPLLVGKDEVASYADLADPKWHGKFCLRKATYTYTRALIASFLLGDGLEATERLLRGWVANNDKPIYVGDLYVLQAMEAEECAFGLANSDYFARYSAANPETPLRLLWADQAGRGVHVNVTGFALPKQSAQPELALRFLEQLVASEAGMAAFADAKKEYPTIAAFAPRSGILEAFGPFRADPRPLREIAEQDEAAQALASNVGYHP